MIGDGRQVQDQIGGAAEGRVHDHGVVQRGVGQDVAHRAPCALRARSTARAERRAMSSQIGWPEGASAECGSAMPSASATTCEVAAVPRNWQPPPGEAQARQPSFGRFFERDLAVREARADGLDLAGVLALLGQQRHAAGHQHAGQIVHAPASAIIIAGRPLSQVATPSTPRRVGSERIRRRKTVAASLR